MDIGEKRQMLAQALLKVEDEAECLELLEDICTIKELDDMANRFQIAMLLYKGKTFVDVEGQIGASSATISRVNKCLKTGTGYLRIIERLIDKEDDKR